MFDANGDQTLIDLISLEDKGFVWPVFSSFPRRPVSEMQPRRHHGNRNTASYAIWPEKGGAKIDD